MTLQPNEILFLLFVGSFAIARIEIHAELDTRFEYQHRFKTFFQNNGRTSEFVSQRTCMNVAHANTEMGLKDNFNFKCRNLVMTTLKPILYKPRKS